MSVSTLKAISKNIETLLSTKNKEITLKKLALRADMSYSTLVPIVKGERDFGVTRLLAIAEALNVTPNDLLKGAYKPPIHTLTNETPRTPPKYLATCIPSAETTRFLVREWGTEHEFTGVFTFSLACTDTPMAFFEKISTALESLVGHSVSVYETAIYVGAISCEFLEGRDKITRMGRKEFHTFILEPDWYGLHRSLFPDTNGISLIVNHGYIIVYSTDQGKTLKRKQGYGFPISDQAGLVWLGAEAIRHSVNVAEGLTPKSLLSERIMSLAGSDFTQLAIKVYQSPQETYAAAASMVKELSGSDSAAKKIVAQGFNNIWSHIEAIDQESETALPIAIMGDLAYLYAPMIPENRINAVHFTNQIDTAIESSMSTLEHQIWSEFSK